MITYHVILETLSIYATGYMATLLGLYFLRKSKKSHKIGISKDDLMALLIWPIFGGFVFIMSIMELLEIFF